MGNIFSITFSCDTIISRCWDSIAGQEQPYSRLEENLQALTTSLQELTSLKNDVKRRVDVAEQLPQTKVLEQVHSWILRVETVEAEVNEVVNSSIQQVDGLICGGCCSMNYFSGYKYGKRVAKKLVEVAELKSRGVFEEVAAEILPATLVDEKPIEATVGMESEFEKVWSHIENEDVGVIGIYGMGGVGKTTLLTKINNNFHHTLNDFRRVIWVVISRDHKIDIIQNKIGEQIGYSSDAWKHKEQNQKAEAIFRVLNKQQFVLLMDDIWEPVEIIKLGVPVPNNRNRSKIIFTTRSEDVCCNMDAREKIKMECLSSETAWDLFQEKVGKEALSVHHSIPRLAEAVANECGGLPLALITVGRAMACKKTPQEWSHAIHVLKNSAAEFSAMGDKVFPLLKFSYDNLRSEKIKSCFLYCALFPEDFCIDKEELLYCWMGEELLDDYRSVDEARNESYHIIGTLVNACLLEVDGTGVKMHDVIRDMALWVACDVEKINESFRLHPSPSLTDAVPFTAGGWGAKRVSLMANDIVLLDFPPDCPNLLTLFLGRNNLKSIVPDFFSGMPALKVLDLSGNQNLTKLPSGVANLVSLQHLNLSATRIRVLPWAFEDLQSLQYLNLEHMTDLEFIPQCILMFQKLRVLRMFNSGSLDRLLYSRLEGPMTEVDIKRLDVLTSVFLGKLDVLTLSIENTSCFRNWFKNNGLLRCTQSLDINDCNNQLSSLDITSLAMREHLRSLRISNYPNLEEFEIEWAGQAANVPNPPSLVGKQTCFLSLQFVSVSKCKNLKDLTWLIFAPHLIHLNVTFCYEIEKMIDLEKLGGVANVVEESKPFAKLTFLNLKFLPVLKSIYENPLPFPSLKEVKIAACPALKMLPLNSSSARGCNLIIEGEEEWWSGLEWEDELAPNVFLPSFRARS